MQKFIGRKKELQKLSDLSHLKRPRLVVVKGRRRVGKSRLIQEFAKTKRFFSFAGIAPSTPIKHTIAQDQRNDFTFRLSAEVKSPIEYSGDWSQAFSNLTKHLTQEETVILLDEISWMSDGDPTFISKLKNWWDLELLHFPNLTLVFCGSVSTWIEENIINSTAFFGRITLTIELEALSISESTELIRSIGFKGSSYEIIKILSITGGIPWYLEQISPVYMADQNIKKLCFEKGGMLTNEFDAIFHDLFQHRGKVYKAILEALKDGMKNLAEIRTIINYHESGTLSANMNHLITAGFVTKHAQRSINTGKVKKQSLYRLSDTYLRFYLKYISPIKDKIEQNFFDNIELNQIIGFDSIMGFQVESLLLQNRPMLLEAIGVNTTDCVFDNPYYQKSNSKQEGLQIDYLVQTRSKNIFICEFKFNRGRISNEVIDEAVSKMSKLKIPRGYALAPILFHFGEISEAIFTRNFYYRIVDISKFLETC
jgi:AAA+ ATPase superfamily predicted ATPase